MKQMRYYKQLIPEYLDLFLEKGPVFRELWLKRFFAKKGMTKDMSETFDLMFEEFMAIKLEKKMRENKT